MGRAEAASPQTGQQEGGQGPSVAEISRYRRREPEKSLLHQIVRGHLKTFLAETEQDGNGLPRFVVAEFREDVLACPCGGRRKVSAFIDEKPVIERILGHLGLPTTGPPTAPARLSALAESSLWQDDVPELQQSLR